MPLRAQLGLLLGATAALGDYVQLSSQDDNCATAGRSAILSLAECETAARLLKLKDTTAHETNILFRSSTPAGCYVETGLLTGGLWFNPDLTSTANGKAHGDTAVCSTDPPAPTPPPGSGPRQAQCGDVCSYIKSKGYPCECHGIRTPDGFLLQTARIPAKPGAKAVWLMHGFEDSCITWVSQPRQSDNLGFMLHDAGYDVWMGNSRGNVFSLSNNQLDIEKDEFWKAIDFDQMADKDLPSNIAYVLNATGQPYVYYAGHSQGTLQFFAAMSRHYRMPDGTLMSSRIRAAAMLAPVCYIHHTQSMLLKVLAELGGDGIIKMLGFKQFLGPNIQWILNKLTIACKVLPTLCPTAVWPIMGGGNFSNADPETYRVATRYAPSDSSVWNLIHWAQHVRDMKFDLHDWGDKNQKYYNQTEPPPYNLTRVTGTKVAIFYGDQDDLADVGDVAVLLRDLPNETLVKAKKLTGYGHVDFVWGKDAHQRVYSDVLDHFAAYP